MSRVLKIYSDGGSRGNPGPSASAFVVIDGGKIIHKEAKFLGRKTNNEAEYYGVILALKWLTQNKNILKDVTKLFFFMDSELVVRQIIGMYRVKGNNLKPLIIKVRRLLNELKTEKDFVSIPREKNKIADLLLNKEIDENFG